MFGEIDMYGTYILKIDDASRICIPSETKAESGEKFVLLESSLIEGGIDIYSLENFNKIYLNLLEEQKKTNDVDQKKKLKKEQIELLKSVKKVVKADKNRRIIVRDLFEPGNVDFLCVKDYAILTKSKVKK